MAKGQIEKKLVELEGEYRVAAELASRGFVPIPTPRNYPGTDLLVMNPDNGRAVQVQVKTRDRSPKRKFLLHSSDEARSRENRFYVLVNLQGRASPPEYFIVPSQVLAARIGLSHRSYISGGHADSSIRRFIIDATDRKNYQDRWDLLSSALS